MVEYLQTKNKVLIIMFPVLHSNIILIGDNKNNILDIWMSFDIVKSTLKYHNFEISFFREKFASKVFDYATDVIKSKNEPGNCPVIGVMLILFKKKNIPLSDVFLICVNFKNALLNFTLQNNLLNDKMLSEISILVDYNFYGVIKEYVELYYSDNNVHEINTILLQKNTTQEIQSTSITTTVPVLKITSAQEYLLEVYADIEAIAELDELEIDTLNTVDTGKDITKKTLLESAYLFEKYAAVLSTLYEFEQLSYTLTVLKDLLYSTDFKKLDEKKSHVISVYLVAIISDLQNWRISIFVTRDAKDIHQLDKTLMSSIAQLQAILMPDVENQVENKNDDFELF